ncbi:unnamed protein product [Caenorhabditis nigoni]
MAGSQGCDPSRSRTCSFPETDESTPPLFLHKVKPVKYLKVYDTVYYQQIFEVLELSGAVHFSCQAFYKLL